MDTDFDGFMKTLDNIKDNKHNATTTSSFDADIEKLLASDGSSYLKTKNAMQTSIATTIRIENEVHDIGNVTQSVDSNHTGEFASMHDQFMQSIKEIKDLNLSHDSKRSELNPTNSIDSRVDAELKELLETGICKQEEPEQNDTVELSISDDDNDMENQSESEIILEDIDDLESIKSAAESVVSSATSNTNNTKHIDSGSESNEAEYDLESFGIKEAVTSHSSTPKPKPISSKPEQKHLRSLRSSLPSTSSFENQSKTQQTSTIVSNVSSILSTPRSHKSTFSDENRADLTKLKQKLKSDQSRKKQSNESTPFKTPMKQLKNKVIQTPRHSLKHSVKSAKHTPAMSCIASSSSPSIVHELEEQLEDKDKIINDMKDRMEAQNVEMKNAECRSFGLECQLKEIERSTCIREKEASEMNTVSVEEAERLKKEIESMDRIVEGLNEENAKLIQELKQEKLDLRHSQQMMYNANQKMNHNLKTTQQQLTEMEQSKMEELQPAAFNEIQRVRKQMKETKETSMCRERELGREMSKLKEENRSLQFKLDGMDHKSFENESNIVQEFKKEALKIQKKSQQQIHELQRKLKWYIENQELIQNLNQQIMHKNKEIVSLKSSQSNSPISIHKAAAVHRVKPTPHEHRQIVQLKKKVRDLERLLSSKHPDSIANLISMMNTNNNDNDDTDNIMIKQLREQIAMVQEALDNKEDEALSRLRGLRQQNDKVQLTLNNKIKNLERQLTNAKRQKGFVKPSTRIKELEQQIRDLKQTHCKKMKILKDKHVTQMRTLRRNRKQEQEQHGSNDDDDNEEMITIQKDLECKMNDIERLNTKLNEKECMIQNLQMIVETEKASHHDLKTQIYLLQTQLKNAIKQHENRKSDDNIECELDDDEKEKEKEKIKMMQSEINEYKRQCEVWTEKVELERSKGEQSVKAMHNELEWNKLEKEKIEQLIVKLQFELNHAKHRPSYVEYESLLRKLDKIEKRGGERERELEETYMKLLHSNDDSEEQLTTKYEAIIVNKEEKIQSLQNELSVLMTAFDKIQANP